jgi:hypothetical protein
VVSVMEITFLRKNKWYNMKFPAGERQTDDVSAINAQAFGFYGP